MIQRLKDGTILRGRYRLNNIVGQGGMGNVYQAEDLRLPGRLCAIKEVQLEARAIGAEFTGIDIEPYGHFPFKKQLLRGDVGSGKGGRVRSRPSAITSIRARP